MTKNGYRDGISTVRQVEIPAEAPCAAAFGKTSKAAAKQRAAVPAAFLYIHSPPLFKNMQQGDRIFIAYVEGKVFNNILING
jgi:hypothetical protein